MSMVRRNIQLYPWFQACASAHFWLPVFFLYFLSVLTVEQVLVLEAIYYWAVVALEVPSGYFSDRVGRRVTLLIAGGGWTGAYLLFALTQTFPAFVVAQILLAVGMSFKSGTDTSLLFDSLQAENRAEEVGVQEGRAHSFGFFASAAAALAGGLLAGFDLRIAYLLSAVGGLVAFLVAWRMVEPPREHQPAESAIVAQVGKCLRRLRNPVLAWVAFFVVAMTVFNHIPYEFFQPYLDLLIERFQVASELRYSVTPAASSVLVAVTMLVSAWGSRRAMRWQTKLGTVWSLLATMLLQGVIIFSMSAVLHPLIVALLLLRSMPRAVMSPIVNATVHPLIPSGIRATFLSLQSFAGRLLFGGLLLATSWYTAGIETLTRERLSAMLLVYSFVVAAVLSILVATSGAMRSHEEASETP